MSAKPETEDTSTFAAMYEAWAKYEERKNQLPKDLSPDEHRAECQRIADELGI